MIEKVRFYFKRKSQRERMRKSKRKGRDNQVEAKFNVKVIEKIEMKVKLEK